MSGSEQREMLPVLCGQGYCMLQTFTWVQKTKWNWVKWNKNVSPNTEKSLSKHTGDTPAIQDSADPHPAGNICLKCVSVWLLCPVAEDPELKDHLVSVRLLFHFFCCVEETRVQKSSVYLGSLSCKRHLNRSLQYTSPSRVIDWSLFIFCFFSVHCQILF